MWGQLPNPNPIAVMSQCPRRPRIQAMLNKIKNVQPTVSVTALEISATTCPNQTLLKSASD